MEKIKLSIIIPVYNVEIYLEECIESVLSQKTNEVEIIAVNDGSTDNSLKILQNYERHNKKIVVIDQVNGGLSKARNIGLEHAKGEYVYFLDSDDYLLSNALKNMLDFIQSNNLELALFNALNSNEEYYFSESIIINSHKKEEFLIEMDSLDFSLPPVPVWLYLYRRDFIEKHGLIFLDGLLHEDVHFTLKSIIIASRIGLKNIPIQYHRVQREGAITSQINFKHIESMLIISRKLYEELNEYDIDKQILKKKIFLTYINNAEKVLRMDKRPKKVFSGYDSKIMKDCLFDSYWTMHYLLLKYNLFTLYKWYIDSKNQKIKKNLRRIVQLISRLR